MRKPRKVSHKKYTNFDDKTKQIPRVSRVLYFSWRLEV